MPIKGMSSFLFHGFPPPQSSSTPPTPLPSENLSSACVSEIISKAEAMVTKWNPGTSTFAKITSLFNESCDEARVFLCAVVELNRAMHYLMTATVASSPANSARHDLVRAHRLMETAMKRLQTEFFQILSANRDRLDSDSLVSTPASLSDVDDDDDANTIALSEEDEIKLVGETLRNVERLPSPAMADLKSIATCMVASGYGKECVKIYKIMRKSIVDEGIDRLRFERLSQSQIQKLDWESVVQRVMNWLTAARFVFETLFSWERVLCDYIFGSSSFHIKESCFAEITRQAAVQFLEFPELVAAATATMTTKKSSKCKSKSKSKSDEKMYHLLDLHNAITDLWPVIESVFSYNATTTVRSQAISSLQKLGESVRATLAEFEMSIQKDSTKVVPDGGLQPITRRVMDNLVSLADYIPALNDIFIDHPLPPTTTNYPSSTSSSSSSSISARFAWLALVLFCKLDSKAELYKDVALSYLFLANNLHYIVSKVINTPSLFQILEEAWALKHEEKARGFAKSYQRMGWAKVEAAVEEGKVGEFNRVFKETCRVQSAWVVVDERMREEVVQSVRSKVVVPYRDLYERRRVPSGGGDEEVRYAPEDVEIHLTNLFGGVSGTSVSMSDSSVGSGSSSLSSLWRTG